MVTLEFHIDLHSKFSFFLSFFLTFSSFRSGRLLLTQTNPLPPSSSSSFISQLILMTKLKKSRRIKIEFSAKHKGEKVVQREKHSSYFNQKIGLRMYIIHCQSLLKSRIRSIIMCSTSPQVKSSAIPIPFYLQISVCRVVS